MVSASLTRHRPPHRGGWSRGWTWTPRWAFVLLTVMGTVGLSLLCFHLPEDLAHPHFLHWEGPSISSFSPIIDTSLLDSDEDLVVEFEKNVPFPMRADTAIGRKPIKRKAAQKHVDHVEAGLAPPPRPPPRAVLAVPAAKPDTKDASKDVAVPDTRPVAKGASNALDDLDVAAAQPVIKGASKDLAVPAVKPDPKDVSKDLAVPAVKPDAKGAYNHLDVAASQPVLKGASDDLAEAVAKPDVQGASNDLDEPDDEDASINLDDLDLAIAVAQPDARGASNDLDEPDDEDASINLDDLDVAAANPDVKSDDKKRRVEVGVPPHGQEGSSRVSSALDKGTHRLFKEGGYGSGSVARPPEGQTCRAFLESSDHLDYSRDFHAKPILVHGRSEEGLRSECDLGCDFRDESATSAFKSDATFDEPRKGLKMPPSVHINMESSINYPMSRVSAARERGYGVVMTTNLDSDVPVTYGAWTSTVPFRPATPVARKNDSVVALISNCAASNFRNEAVAAFQDAGVEVRSYGQCMHNMPEPPRSKIKEEIVPPNKFTLAFENSNEEDYVTEKFFDALEYGAVPIVIGAPNIAHFAPASNSYLAMESRENITGTIERVKYLMSHDDEYEQMLAWKKRGASDSFLALVDLGNVHSACRLCIHLADNIRATEDEQREEVIQRRPCSCQERGEGKPVVHHLYIREKGKFYSRSIFLNEPLTIAGLHKAILEEFGGQFKPIWTQHRPSYRKQDAHGAWDKEHFELRIHRIFPQGVTYREALYGESGDFFRPTGNDKTFEKWVAEHPCAELEVIFV